MDMKTKSRQSGLTPKKVNFAIDKEYDGCNMCSSRFSVVCRKHVCRTCDKSFCGKCSESKVITSQGALVRERICAMCNKSSSTISTESRRKNPSPFTPSKLHMVDGSGGRRHVDDLWDADSESDCDSDSDAKSLNISNDSVKENLTTRISNEPLSDHIPVHIMELRDEILKDKSNTLSSNIESSDTNENSASTCSQCALCNVLVTKEKRGHTCSRCTKYCCRNCTKIDVSTNGTVLTRQRLCVSCSDKDVRNSSSASSPFTPSKLHLLEDSDNAHGGRLLWSADTETDSESEASHSANQIINSNSARCRDGVEPEPTAATPTLLAQHLAESSTMSTGSFDSVAVAVVSACKMTPVHSGIATSVITATPLTASENTQQDQNVAVDHSLNRDSLRAVYLMLLMLSVTILLLTFGPPHNQSPSLFFNPFRTFSKSHDSPSKQINFVVSQSVTEMELTTSQISTSCRRDLPWKVLEDNDDDDVEEEEERQEVSVVEFSGGMDRGVEKPPRLQVAVRIHEMVLRCAASVFALQNALATCANALSRVLTALQKSIVRLLRGVNPAP